MKSFFVSFIFSVFSIVSFAQSIPDNYTGDWVSKYDNGQISFEGKFIDGKQIGKSVYYFENGKVRMEGNYVDGLKDGEWTAYFVSGEIRFKVNYLKGEQVGDRKYY